MGVFVNTMMKTLLLGVIGTHWVYKNGFRFSWGWFPAIAYKWSCNIAIQRRGVWMTLDAAVGKP